ncbi:hypothetical protein EZV62_000809 [Acer yangbiense]|uniref:IBB domain-containing protein n=1 Tax=Acer yangbiense TaxID=1000413 RepID=A0A5C7ISC3_9ROSI|nr:hypothetical protein EZV62_000809 [Acer yangbiense]
MEKSSLPVAEQCAWALGNVAGEGDELRNILLSQGSLPPLARMMLPNKGSTVRTAAWALSNLIKGPDPKAATELIRVDGVVEAILRHLKKADEELATEVAWVVVYLPALSNIAISILVKSDVLQLLVERLATSNSLQLLILVSSFGVGLVDVGVVEIVVELVEEIGIGKLVVNGDDAVFVISLRLHLLHAGGGGLSCGSAFGSSSSSLRWRRCDVDVDLDHHGKNSWPELVGVLGEEAAATIERENPTVSALILLEGSIVLPMFLCTRVYVWVNTSGICVEIPMIG